MSYIYIIMVSKRWIKSKSVVYNINYHLIWCVKYRKKLLVDNVEKRLKEILNIKAKDIDVVIKKMETDNDHIHMFISASPTSGIHWIVQQFKGVTSRLLRKEFSNIKSKVPSLWTRSYYVETIGYISEDTIKKYIENQKNY